MLSGDSLVCYTIRENKMKYLDAQLGSSPVSSLGVVSVVFNESYKRWLDAEDYANTKMEKYDIIVYICLRYHLLGGCRMMNDNNWWMRHLTSAMKRRIIGKLEIKSLVDNFSITSLWYQPTFLKWLFHASQFHCHKVICSLPDGTASLHSHPVRNGLVLLLLHSQSSLGTESLLRRLTE